MTNELARSSNVTIRDVRRDIAEASNPQILKIVAAVEAVANRGQADELISPFRDRLTTLQPPRRLRFSRLLFHPFNVLIVPAARWRPGKALIPRSVLMPIAEHVRIAMGAEAASIEAKIDGRTTHDTDLISKLGHMLWPAAAKILAKSPPPENVKVTGLNATQFQGLAMDAAALLSQAAALEALCAETENGLLTPPPEAIHAILRGVAAISQSALPMIVSLLLMRVPEAGSLFDPSSTGTKSTAMNAALEHAADLLVEQLETDGPEMRVAAGTMVAAGVAIRQMTVLLIHLESSSKKPARKAQVLQIRGRLDTACKARFTTVLEQELLTPLRDLAASVRPASPAALEATARGLRVLEAEARAAGSGRTYDTLLAQASGIIKSEALAEKLELINRVRLVEILEGTDAALALLPKIK